MIDKSGGEQPTEEIEEEDNSLSGLLKKGDTTLQDSLTGDASLQDNLTSGATLQEEARIGFTERDEAKRNSPPKSEAPRSYPQPNYNQQNRPQQNYNQPSYNQSNYSQQSYAQPSYRPSYNQPRYPQAAAVGGQGYTPYTAKDALSGATGGFWMLVATIVVTINFIVNIVGNFSMRSIDGIINVVFTFLTALGFWITYISGVAKKPSAAGITLIKIPFVIQFALEVIAFIGIALIIVLSVIGSYRLGEELSSIGGGSLDSVLSIIGGIGIVIVVIFVFIFVIRCMYYKSVKKTLNLGIDVARNKSVAGRDAGMFAPVMMIISALCTFFTSMIKYEVAQELNELFFAIIGELGGPFEDLFLLTDTAADLSFGMAIVTFIASISSAIVMISFRNKLKRANG